MTKKRIDKRRRIEAPKSFEVDRLISFRNKVEFVRDPATGLKKLERLVPEYLVHWKGYNNSHNLWVKKEDITKDCVDEFNGRTISSASEMLATVPVALHPSSPGYAMAKKMSSMMKQKVILKDGVHAPKRSRICAGKYIPSKATLSTLTSFTKPTLDNSKSTNHFNSKLNIEEVNSEESKKGEGVMIDQGEK